MTTTYYLRDTLRAFAAGTFPVEMAMEQAQGSSATLTRSVASSSTDVATWTFSGPDNEPGLLDWPSGGSNNYALSFDVVTMGTSLSCLVQLIRYTAGGGTSRGLIYSTSTYTTTFTGTGIKTSTVNSTTAFTFTVNDNGLRATSDIPVLRVFTSNTDMMSAFNMVWNVNDADSFFTAPWTMSSADPVPHFASRSLQAVRRASTW